MHPNIEQLLERVRPKHLSAAEKHVLWSRIETRLPKRRDETRARATHGFFGLFYIMKNRAKFAIAALVSVVVLGSSGATVALADNAKPGDFLFSVDIAAERMRLAFTTKEKKDELIIRFSEERLDEVKVVLALADTNTDDNKKEIAASSQIATAVSEEIATSTPDNTATSTPDTSENADTSEEDSRMNAAENALSVALDHLQQNKQKLLDDGNMLAASIIDEIIVELQRLAESHITKLQKLEVKTNNQNLKLKIKTATQKIETKFKVQNENSGNGQGNGNVKIEIRQKDDKNEIKFKDNSIKIEFKSKSDDNDDEKIENEENDDDNNEDENDNHKIIICHKPNKRSGETISIDYHAVRTHLKHGDKLGRCGGNNNEEPPADTAAPVISSVNTNPNVTSSSISWTTNENAKGSVWYSTSTPINLAHASRKNEGSFVTNHSVTLSSLTASTTYYFVVTARDPSENAATSTESSFTTLPEPPPADTTPPVISGVSAIAATTTAAISWNTNESANSAAWYGASTPLPIAPSTSHTSNASFVTSHSASLAGLSDGTTYYFVVVSADSSGNAATSTESSFTTNTIPPPDTTPPVISALTASGITATSTAITWTTDENANGKVLLGTTTPVNNGNALFSNTHADFIISHSLGFSGLTASTTYYYIAIATDTSGNTATSTEQLFTTP